MVKKLTSEEQKLVDTVIVEMKKLVKKYGYDYVKIGATKYLTQTKERARLLSEIKSREKELEDMKDNL